MCGARVNIPVLPTAARFSATPNRLATVASLRRPPPVPPASVVDLTVRRKGHALSCDKKGLGRVTVPAIFHNLLRAQAAGLAVCGTAIVSAHKGGGGR